MRVDKANKVAILDRDGTIVVDRGYLDNAEGLEFTHGAQAGLRCLSSHGYRIVVITNQSGVGRGRFSMERVHEMNARLFEMFEELGVRLDGIYVCPHAPEEGCGCRKPRLGLVLQAASDLSFDPAQAIFIGDKESDIECGRRAGARAILIATSAVDYGRSTHAAVVAQDLHEAALAVVTA